MDNAAAVGLATEVTSLCWWPCLALDARLGMAPSLLRSALLRPGSHRDAPCIQLILVYAFLRLCLQLRDLASLQPLFGLRKLEFLHLGSSPVTQQPHYRSWLVHNLPSLRWLDYAKVKGKERESATKLYTSSEGEGRPSELAQQLSAARVSATVNGGDANGHGGPAARTFEVPGSGPGPEPQKAKGLSEEQRQRIRKAIERAGTLEEIQRLKRMLADGHLPSEREAKALTA